MVPRLILASASPRRAQLLSEAGFVFEVVVVPDVVEDHDPALTCEALTTENARRKAVASARLCPDALTIGADTLVYIDQHPLGKPADMEEARAMLRRLSARQHQVCTGVAFAWDGGRQVETFAVITEVFFKEISDALAATYHAQVHVLDKAGGYAVQEHGSLIVEHVEGSLSNVIGLPMEALIEALQRHAIHPRNNAPAS